MVEAFFAALLVTVVLILLMIVVVAIGLGLLAAWYFGTWWAFWAVEGVITFAIWKWGW